MKAGIPCLLVTRDETLIQRVKAYAQGGVLWPALKSPGDLYARLSSADPALILLDVRGVDLRDLLDRVHSDWPRTQVLALGEPRSDPLLEAEALGVYASDALDFDGPRFQATLRRALDHIRLTEEVRLLRETLQRPGAFPAGPRLPDGGSAPERLPMRLPLPVLRHSGKTSDLIADIVDSLVHSGLVLRAGVFVYVPERKVYRLAVAFGVREEVRALEFEPDAPLIGWLERNAHLVARSGLAQIRSTAERFLLEQALDTLGAELIAPLQGRRRFVGWLFIGPRATGLTFDAADLLDIMLFAEHAAVAIENAALYDDLAFQHTLAETLLHSLSSGIVLAGADGRIRWLNDSAERLLGLELGSVVDQPVERLGSRLADALRRTLQAETAADSLEWTDAPTQRHMSVRTQRLMNGTTGLGAVAFIQDLTRERALNEKQEELERTLFWNELAAAISHEIRNPLVAIKTFAQLLPERYQDPEFQNEFQALVSGEVDRLTAIIDQINDFAHRPELKFQSLALAPLIAKSVGLVLPPGETTPIQVITVIPDGLPPIWGDEQTLVESFTHILRNAVEALTGRPEPRIRIEAGIAHESTPHALLTLVFQDNGHGLPPALADKVFSPFCTTKARGLGLGLPIVRRTVIDHNGRVEIRSDAGGTTVRVHLPVRAPEAGRT